MKSSSAVSDVENEEQRQGRIVFLLFCLSSEEELCYRNSVCFFRNLFYANHCGEGLLFYFLCIQEVKELFSNFVRVELHRFCERFGF